MKKILFIIEGVDNSGKSTFISKVFDGIKCDRWDISKIPKGKDDTEDLKKFYDLVLQCMLMSDRQIQVMDRYYPSEIVYSEVMRKYKAEDDPWYKNFEKVLAAVFDVHILICHPSFDTLDARFQILGDSYITQQVIYSLREGYRNIAKWSQFPVQYFDTADASIFPIARRFVENIIRKNIESPEELAKLFKK
jgi:thymidylate kinase